MKRLLGILSALIVVILTLFYFSNVLTVKIQYTWLVLAILLSILFFVIYSLRIGFFITKLTNKTIIFLKILKFEFLSRTIYVISPLKIYLPVRVLLMSKYLSIDLRDSATVISFEFIMDNIPLVLVSFAFLLAFPSILPTYLFWPLIILIASMFITIAIVFICSLLNYKPSITLTRLLDRFKRGKIITNVLAKFVTSLEKGFSQIVHIKKNLLYVSILSALIVFVMSIKTWFLFKAVDVNVGVLVVFFVTTVSILIGILSMIPGGLVVRELTGLTLYASFGVNPTLATVVLIVDRVITYLILFAGGAYVLSEVGVNITKYLGKEKTLSP